MAENLDVTGNGAKLNEPLHGLVILDAWLFDMSAKLKLSSLLSPCLPYDYVK
jgi:hypothetical protein